MAAPAAGPRSAAELPPSLVVFSDRHLIGEGLVGLLSDDSQERTVIVSDVAALEQAAGGSLAAAIIDAGTGGAGEAAELVRTLGGTVIVLVASVDDELDPRQWADADAIVVHDEVEPLTLRIALTVRRLGMRLVPRGLPDVSPAQLEAAPLPPLDQPAQRALELLAEGHRDAEIALELNLSESAVRKLIQRTVRRSGARTRCQAVAAAIRDGELS